MEPLDVTAYTLVNALGRGAATSLQALRDGTGGLQPWRSEADPLPTWVGRVEGLESTPVEGPLNEYDCRNNRLAQLALRTDGFAEAVAAARERLGPGRIGVFIGTSTSGIGETEAMYRAVEADAPLPDYPFGKTQSPFSVAEFTRHYLDLDGPASVIATACSSSAKVFAVAQRHIAAGLCDAAVVGGVDSLCLSTLYGFNSLELIAAEPCRPWDTDRGGINIGEAGGFALLERPGRGGRARLLGYGESSDAYHMSTPHPEGAGAALALRRALARSALEPTDIDYINLHGTGTRSNDQSEDRAVAAIFGTAVPCSSTKGWTGHTLGAAGICEAVFACLAIEHGLLPGTLNTREPDPELAVPVVVESRPAKLKRVMSNSFGFGGSNCTLVFGRAE